MTQTVDGESTLKVLRCLIATEKDQVAAVKTTEDAQAIILGLKNPGRIIKGLGR
jgi:hypothetical protein